MNIQHERRGAIDCLSLSGRVDAATAPDLEAMISSLAVANPAGVVLDLHDVDYVSSAGLRVFLIGVRALGGDQNQLVLARASAEVEEVIRLTGFQKILTLCGTVDDAIAHIEGGR